MGENKCEIDGYHDWEILEQTGNIVDGEQLTIFCIKCEEERNVDV